MFQILRIVNLALNIPLQFCITYRSQCNIPIHLIMLSRSNDISRNIQRNGTNSRNIGVQESTTEFLFCNARSKTFRGSENHSVSDFGGLTEDGAETETGEDVHVVSLAGGVGFAFVRCFGEGRARGEEDRAVSPGNRLFEITFRLFTWITQSYKLAKIQARVKYGR